MGQLRLAVSVSLSAMFLNTLLYSRKCIYLDRHKLYLIVDLFPDLRENQIEIPFQTTFLMSEICS